MKKKLIQILMLLVATVSVGSFVSCKDTNEDLYNELRTQNLENATVAEALAARIDALEKLVAGIESCECDTVKMLGWVNSEDAYLQAQIAALDAALKALDNDTYSKAEIDGLLADLADEYAALADFLDLKKDYDTYVLTNNVAVQVLKDKVKDLEDALKDIVSCKCDLEKLGILEGRIIEAEENAKEALNGLKDIEKIANAAQVAADKAQQAADKAQQAADDAAAVAKSANLTANEAKAIAETCKTLLNTALTTATEAKTIAAEAKTMAETNKSRIEKLEKDLQTLDGKINVVSETANQAVKDAAAAAAKADANKALIDALTERVTNNEKEIATNKANIEALQESIKKFQDLAEKVGANTEAINTLKENISDVNTKLQEMNTKYEDLATALAALQQQVTDCQQICAANLAAAKAELRTEIQDLESQLLKEIAANDQAIADLAKQHDADVEWIKEALRQLSKKTEGYITIADLKPITDKLTELENTDKGLDSRLTAAEATISTLAPTIATLETSIDDLSKRVAEAEQKVNDAVAAVTTALADLQSFMDELQDYLRNMVTGITIQGTHNPMFGTFSIPVNIQSNVIVAYYNRPSDCGKGVRTLEFPTYQTSSYGFAYVPKSPHYLTAEDFALIETNMRNMEGTTGPMRQTTQKILVNVGKDGNAYAGKVYVTVNPTSADVQGLELQIVNSQDEPSLFKLTPLKKSNKTLEFGYSRADNGFYEADAYISKNTYLDNVERPFDKEALVTLAKEAKSQFEDIAKGQLGAGHTSLDDLATKVYNVVRTLRLDQSGLKCPYDKDETTGQYKNAVYSQYNLAATALKPLDLAWGKDFVYQTVTGYERVEKMLEIINKKLKGFTAVLHNKDVNKLFDDLGNEEFFKDVTLNELSPSFLAKFKITIDKTFFVDNVQYTLVLPVTAQVPVKYAKGLTVGGVTITTGADVDLAYFDGAIAKNVKDAIFAQLKTIITKPTAVVTNKDNGALETVLVVPINDYKGDIQGFAKFPLEDTQVDYVSNQIIINNSVAADVTGTSLSIAGYDQNVMIDEVYYSFNVDPTQFVYNKTIDFGPAIAEIWGKDYLGEVIGDVNEVLAHVRTLIDDALTLKRLIDKYESKYTNLVESYFGVDGKLHDYLDKINKVIVNFINGINYQLGPFMVTEDAKGFKVLSVDVNNPTTMSKDQLKLYLTSKNLELLCPYARKHVAVTNVYSSDLTKSVQAGTLSQSLLTNANSYGDINAVIDGTQRMVEVGNVQSGYIYEFAYSVLDFEGNISTRKSYIKIK